MAFALAIICGLHITRCLCAAETSLTAGSGHGPAVIHAHYNERKTSQGVPVLASCALGPASHVMAFCIMQDWEVAKKRQDKALDHIEKGLSTLKGIGEAMGETLTQQGVVLDAIDEKVSLRKDSRECAS